MKLKLLNMCFAAGCTLTPIAGSAAENLSAENNNVVKEPYAIFSWDMDQNTEIASLEDEINDIYRIWIENDCREG